MGNSTNEKILGYTTTGVQAVIAFGSGVADTAT